MSARLPRLLRRSALLLGLLVVLPAGGHAAGPLIVNGAGTPLVWTASAVPFNPDQGSLGLLDNAGAVVAVTANFDVWAAVPTSTITYTNAGTLPVDVTADDVFDYLGVCGDGFSPIIFDTDGSIIDDLFGPGASNSILGFAGPDCATFVPAEITEGAALLNGRFIDGIDDVDNGEITQAEFNGVFIHEFGHYSNLDHSQIGLQEAFDGDLANDAAVATMFPILVNGTEAATLALDDRVSISALYPEPVFAGSFGAVTGTVFRPDGTTQFQGAYVIARQVGDPRLTAVGVASGARFFPFNDGGPPPAGLEGLYAIPGLPAGSYTVEVEEIPGFFSGGSSVGPLNPPARLPGVPELYNGANEAGANPPDDPLDSVEIPVSASTSASGLDVILNQLPPPPNDDCAAANPIGGLPYFDFQDTGGATSDGADPFASCVFSQNSATIWYQYTAPADTTLVVETSADYDTVLTAYTGGCGALTELACNDDARFTLGSFIRIPMQAGQMVLIEVSSLGGASTGGALNFTAYEVTAYSGTVNDPLGDTFGSETPQLDLSSVSACNGNDTVEITLAFSTPISPADSGEIDALGGYVDIDADQNGATGFPAFADAFSGLRAGIGSEYIVSFFDVNSVAGTVPVRDSFTFAALGDATVSFGARSVTITIPTAVLRSDDGQLDVAALIGTFPEPTDVSPNGGYVSTAPCLSGAGCPAVPATTCRAPTRSRRAPIELYDERDDRRDAFFWSWRTGPETPVSAFGNPRTTTGYDLCIYDANGGNSNLVLASRVSAGGNCGLHGPIPCWKATQRGFTYKDRSSGASGIRRIELEAGRDGQSEISIQGRGAALGVPALPLAKDPRVTVQLHNDVGSCWSASYSQAKANTAKRFVGRGD